VAVKPRLLFEEHRIYRISFSPTFCGFADEQHWHKWDPIRNSPVAASNTGAGNPVKLDARRHRAAASNPPATQDWQKMADNGSKSWPPALLLARAIGKTVKEAAPASGVSERTVYRYLNDPEFRAEVSRIRACIVDEAIGQLVAQASNSVATIIMLENESPNAWLRLRASCAVLELMLKSQKAINESGEVKDLRTQLQDLKEELRVIAEDANQSD
jgi:hypothetical protein